jgi:hypothetical protein
MRRRTKYGEIRAAEAPPSQRFTALAGKLDAVGALSDQTYEELRRSLETTGELYTVDMLLGSVVSRSMEVVDSFLTAFEHWSVGVASALVRLQIDNVLRCHLIAVTPEPDLLYQHLASDLPLRKLALPERLANALPSDQRKRARRHEDWVLVALAAQEHDWIESAYAISSAWVHHSSAHLLTSYKIDGNRLSGRVPTATAQFDEQFLTPIVDVMGAATRTIVNHLNEWTARKMRLKAAPEA